MEIVSYTFFLEALLFYVVYLGPQSIWNWFFKRCFFVCVCGGVVIRLIYLFISAEALGMEPRTSYTPSACSAAELCPPPASWFGRLSSTFVFVSIPVIRLGWHGLGSSPTEGMCVGAASPEARGCQSFIPGDVDLVKMVSARFLHYQVPMFPFVKISILLKILGHFVNVFFLIKLSP